MSRFLGSAALVLLTACGDAAAGGDPGVLATVFDSTADTVHARIAGDIPETGVRHLVTEVAIAPGIDDTTLFTNVFEFDVDGEGRFWVSDSDSRSIFVFAADGSLIRRVGRRGAGPGEFEQNSGMVIRPDGGLAAWDSRNARLAFFDSAGTFTHQWPLPGGFSTNNGLVTDKSGALYLRRPVTDPREGEILGRMGLVRLAEGGAFADSLVPPDLPVQREVYVASREGGTSATSSTFAPNFYWAWTPSGEFVAANGASYEIVVARAIGKPLVIHRAMSPVAIDPDERDYEERRILWNLRQTDPDWSWQGPPIPTTKAPIRSMTVTRDGRIWVQVAVPSDTIPVEERQVFADSTRPVPRHTTVSVYEVFAPTGEFLGRVRFPPRASLIDAEGDVVWGLGRDINDMPAVTRWRVEPGL